MKGLFWGLVGVCFMAATANAEAIYTDRGAQPFSGGLLTTTFPIEPSEFVGSAKLRFPPNCPLNAVIHFISARTGLEAGAVGPFFTTDHGYNIATYNVGVTGDGAKLTRIQIDLSSQFALVNCGVRLFTTSIVDDAPGSDGNPNPL